MEHVNFEEFKKTTNITPKMEKTDSDKTPSNLEIEEQKLNQNVDILEKCTNKISKKSATITKPTEEEEQVPTGPPVPLGISEDIVSCGTVTNNQAPKTPDEQRFIVQMNKELNSTLNITELHIDTKLKSSVKYLEKDMALKNIDRGTPVKIIRGKTLTVNGKKIFNSMTIAEAQKSGLMKRQADEIIQNVSIRPLNTNPKISASTASNTLNIFTKDSEIENSTGLTKEVIIPDQFQKISPGNSGMQYLKAVETANSLVMPSTSKETARSMNWDTFQAIFMPKTHQEIINPKSGKHNLTSFVQNDSQPPIKITKTSTIVSTSQKINEKIEINKPLIFPNKMDDNMHCNMLNINDLPQFQSSQDFKNSNLKALDNYIKAQELNLKISKMRKEFLPEDSASTSSPPLQKQHCNCSQTKCLKLYCSCFAKGELCQDCNCKNCFNTIENEDERQKAINICLARNRNAFKTKIIKTRDHCKCTESHCLKLYCSCFGNGELCQDCNCQNCFNTLKNEEERSMAIDNCLERNPNAFKSKIINACDQSDLRLHSKGCNCRKSNCSMNYCECFLAKIPCSIFCKCKDCKNTKDNQTNSDSLRAAAVIAHSLAKNLAEKAFMNERFDKPITELNIDFLREAELAHSFKRSLAESKERFAKPSTSDTLQFHEKLRNCLNNDVILAVIECMFAKAEECKNSGMSYTESEREVILELSKCLEEIICFAINY